MPAYLIVNYAVENPELYAEYTAAAGPALKFGEGCELIAFDPASEQLEGEGAGHQTVVLRFDSRERAKEIYESGEYQAVVGKRLQATSKHFAVLIDGMA
ncbi:MAG: hypothetical protein CL910_13115 [Deltaproteobacteria bacterium]|jgi:uncharacterized protein (DUF1330 family)|nr:hypothetical protein [Deltaproteobacteria bacterium]